eukprot:5311968-Karenia_brevis.AAC.1
METTINGEQPCFAYDLEGCNKGVNGRCGKGVHRCMRPGCERTHSQRSSQCPFKCLGSEDTPEAEGVGERG